MTDVKRGDVLTYRGDPSLTAEVWYLTATRIVMAMGRKCYTIDRSRLWDVFTQPVESK